MANRQPIAIVLGVNEIASAAAVNLHKAGYAVVMVHDPCCPVIRRGMSFFDALFDVRMTLGGITGVGVDSTLEIRSYVRAREHILVTRLDLSELLIIGQVDVLVDARMQLGAATPQLRKLARFTIGVGAGFVAGEDCDAVVGVTDVWPRERLKGQALVMRSPIAGRWHTPLDVGVRVYKGFPLGYLGSTIIRAPLDGTLRGIARDDTSVPFAADLIDISTGTRRWWGLDAYGVRIGEEIRRALRNLGAERFVPVAPARLRLVHSR